MPEPAHSTTDKFKFKVVDSVTSTGKAPDASPEAAEPATDASHEAAVPPPKASPEAAVPTPTCKRHATALKAILADPAATEDEWLAAAHEMELHGGIKTFDDGPLVRRARNRKRVLVFAAAALVAGCGLVIAFGPVPATPVASPIVSPPVVATDTRVDFGPYMAHLQRKIKRYWFPPKSRESARVKVEFKIYRAGGMSDLKIVRHGPDQASDDAALLAIEHAAPSFEALPEGAPKDVGIEFTFDYKGTNEIVRPQDGRAN